MGVSQYRGFQGLLLGTQVNQGEGKGRFRQQAQPGQTPCGWLGEAWRQRIGTHPVQGGVFQCSRKVKPSGTLPSHAAVVMPAAGRQTIYWVKTGMAKGQLKASRPQEALWAMSSGGSNGDPFKGELGSQRPLRFRRLGLKKQKEQSPKASFLFWLPRQAEAGRRAQMVPGRSHTAYRGLLYPGNA